jgi:hypothetical protein
MHSATPSTSSCGGDAHDLVGADDMAEVERLVDHLVLMQAGPGERLAK